MNLMVLQYEEAQLKKLDLSHDKIKSDLSKLESELKQYAL